MGMKRLAVEDMRPRAANIPPLPTKVMRRASLDSAECAGLPARFRRFRDTAVTREAKIAVAGVVRTDS